MGKEILNRLFLHRLKGEKILKTKPAVKLWQARLKIREARSVLQNFQKVPAGGSSHPVTLPWLCYGCDRPMRLPYPHHRAAPSAASPPLRKLFSASFPPRALASRHSTPSLFCPPLSLSLSVLSHHVKPREPLSRHIPASMRWPVRCRCYSCRASPLTQSRYVAAFPPALSRCCLNSNLISCPAQPITTRNDASGKIVQSSAIQNPYCMLDTLYDACCIQIKIFRIDIARDVYTRYLYRYLSQQFSTILGAIARETGNFNATATSLATEWSCVCKKVQERRESRTGRRWKEPRRFASQLSPRRASKTWGHVFELVRSQDETVTRSKCGNVAVQNSSHQLATFARPTSGLKSTGVSARRYSRGSPEFRRSAKRTSISATWDCASGITSICSVQIARWRCTTYVVEMCHRLRHLLEKWSLLRRFREQSCRAASSSE